MALACHLVLAGCGRSSRHHDRAPASGTGAGADAGQGSGDAGSGAASGAGSGGAGSGGASAGLGGTGASNGAAAGTTAGIAGAATGSSGKSGGTATNGGTAGTSGTSAAGGFAGEGLGTAGDASGGTGGAPDCQDLCAPGAPACCTAALECVSHVPSCRIDVVVGWVDTTSEYAELEAKVSALSGEVAFTLADTDIEWAAAEAPLASRWELHLTREASQQHLAALTSAMADSQAFRVVCDDQPLFVGVFYLIYGAAGLRTPVLHLDDVAHDAVVLKLGAWQGAWLLSSSQGDPDARTRIDQAALRTTFCARSALQVLDPL